MTLDERINNWARAQRSSGGSGGDGLVSSMYTPEAHGKTVDASLDLEDADKVERAWRGLLPVDKNLLRMAFIWRAHPGFICRRLGLKARPTSIYDLALAHAKRALSERLESIEPRPITRVRMQDVVDALARDDVASMKVLD